MPNKPSYPTEFQHINIGTLHLILRLYFPCCMDARPGFLKEVVISLLKFLPSPSFPSFGFWDDKMLSNYLPRLSISSFCSKSPSFHGWTKLGLDKYKQCHAIHYRHASMSKIPPFRKERPLCSLVFSSTKVSAPSIDEMRQDGIFMAAPFKHKKTWRLPWCYFFTSSLMFL